MSVCSSRTAMPVFLASIVMVSLMTQCFADRWSDADPYEKSNRQTHDFNKGFDRGFYRPASRAYGAIVPSPIDVFIGNFSRNLDLPGRAVNYLLQADLTATALVVGRFATNTIIGFGGIGDPATDLGFPDDQTDFGVTLHAWGVERGSYLELPFLGPRTVRQATGMVVDVFLDPMSQVLPARYDRAVFTVSFLDLLSRRQRSGDFLDQMLHESEDSYVATRSTYFDNRERVLNRGLLEDDLEDPYAE